MADRLIQTTAHACTNVFTSIYPRSTHESARTSARAALFLIPCSMPTANADDPYRSEGTYGSNSPRPFRCRPSNFIWPSAFAIGMCRTVASTGCTRAPFVHAQVRTRICVSRYTRAYAHVCASPGTCQCTCQRTCSYTNPRTHPRCG